MPLLHDCLCISTKLNPQNVAECMSVKIKSHKTFPQSSVLYSRKVWRELNLVVLQSVFTTAKLKSASISYLRIISMAIPY